jgi:hypothetical protein
MLPQSDFVQMNAICKQYVNVWRFKLLLDCFAAVRLRVLYSETDIVKSPLIEVRLTRSPAQSPWLVTNVGENTDFIRLKPGGN